MVKRAVITIHGIRTRGEWQKKLVPSLASNDLVPYPLDYGRFSVLRLLLPWTRENQLKWLLNEYSRVVQTHFGSCRHHSGCYRPSIIAHSFGAYLTCQLIERYAREVKFDKVILTGSIAAETMDWPKILEREQVISVLNEVSTKDIWPNAAKIFVGGAGNSGRSKFIKSHERLKQEETRTGHDGTFFEGRYPIWSNFLTSPRLFCHRDVQTICNLMDLAVKRTANAIGQPSSKIRSNLFLPIDGKLKIPEGLHFHMDNEVELTLEIEIGIGSTGRAYKNRRINTVFRIGNSWGDSELPDKELAKIHPDLQWVLSFPIINSDNGKIIGVMSIDGLTDPPIAEGSWTDPKIQELIRELEMSHVRVMGQQLHESETGGL